MLIKNFSDYKKAAKAMRDDVLFMAKNPSSRTKCLIISGEPGIGKSYNSKAVLRDSGRSWTTATSITPVKLYQKMWDCPDGIILFEDSDALLVSKGDATTVLKSSADMYQERELEWFKSNFKSVKIPNDIRGNDNIAKYIARIAKTDKKLAALYERGELFPNRFTFTGQLIILTNLTLKEISDRTDSALANRATHLELIMNLDGALDVIKHAAEIIGQDSDPKNLKTAIDFLTDARTVDYCRVYRKQPSLRSINKILDEIAKGESLNEFILDKCLETPTFDEA